LEKTEQKNNMTSISYLLSITSSSQAPDVLLAIMNTAGRGHALFGTGNEAVSKTLWIIPKGRKNKQEVLAQLQAIPAIQHVSVAVLTQTPEATELEEVRAMFNDVNIDASDVSDDTLSIFLNSKIQGIASYYIDPEHKNRRWGQTKISIKRIEDHPMFSPDWLRQQSKITDYDMERDLTLDDIEVRTMSFEELKEEPEPPPPPPQRKS
jgi:hypothetical protein